MSIILLTYSNSINDTFVTIGIFTAAAARMAPLMNTMLVTGSTLLNSLPMINSLNTSNNFRKYNYSKNSLHTSNYPKPINEISAIRIKNLSFKYRNGSKNQIFKELSVSFKKNSIVGIYGSSGLGKSTFINLITRFLEPTKGKIIFENKKKILSRPEEEKIISSVSQETVLLNENFYKNIALDYKINKSDKLKINKIFKIVQLHEVVKRLNRKSQKLGHRGSLLSGGQKQKIALGRAIFRDSKVLIFDEPFSGIDGISSIKLLKFLNTIKKDKIIIIITHQVFLKKFFDYVYNIKNKKLFLSKAVFS
jgi:ABC-type multidrug transport system fused ATPase/permease subunit